MTVKTFIQPNYGSQSGTDYPTALDAATASMAPIGNNFACHEQTVPNMTVRVDAGVVLSLGTYIVVAAQNTTTITAPGAGTRYDVVALRQDGVVVIIPGTPAAPLVPRHYVPLCVVAVTSSTTSITNAIITDLRGIALSDPNDDILLDIAVNIRYFPTKTSGGGCHAIACDGIYNAVVVGDIDTTDAIIYSVQLVYPDYPVITERANPKNLTLRDVVYIGTSTFVAVGNADTDAYIIRTTDLGVNWTEIAPPTAKVENLHSIIYTGTALIAVGTADATDGYILRSTNGGVNWTEIGNPLALDLYSIARNTITGRICATGAPNGSNQLYTITSDDDGVTWTDRTGVNGPLGTSEGTVSFLPSVGLFVCKAIGNGAVYWSADAVTWTQGTWPTYADAYRTCKAIEITPTLFVIYANKRVFASRNGKDWFMVNGTQTLYAGGNNGFSGVVCTNLLHPDGSAKTKVLISAGAVVGRDANIGVSRNIPSTFWS